MQDLKIFSTFIFEDLIVSNLGVSARVTAVTAVTNVIKTNAPNNTRNEDKYGNCNGEDYFEIEHSAVF